MKEKIMQFIFPPKCIFCKEIMGLGTELEICLKCYKKIKFNEDKIIFKSKYCDGVVAVARYQGTIKKLIKEYKFYNKPSFFRSFTKLIDEKIKKLENEIDFNLIIDVPMYKKKLIERGYNQSSLIAKKLSKIRNVDYSSNILIKISYTKSQSASTITERYLNLKDSYIFNKKFNINGKKILIIDDILTTGNTLNECAKVLKENGAIKVYAVVIATGKRIF